MADESVFIVDIGSSSVKAGFSGEDIPSYVFPSAMTKIPQKHEEISVVLHSFSLKYLK